MGEFQELRNVDLISQKAVLKLQQYHFVWGKVKLSYVPQSG